MAIELTDDEVEEAIYSAKEKKLADIKLLEYKNSLKVVKTYAKPTKEQLRAIVMKKSVDLIPAKKDKTAGLIINDSNREVFELLLMYFSDDPEFEKRGYSFNKGIFLFGPIGCGKTTLMSLFKFNHPASFVVVPCRTVADAYQSKGIDAIHKYEGGIQSSLLAQSYGKAELGICFDDLGTEEEKGSFGNKLEVMAHVILGRYDKIIDDPELRRDTHFTSNLDAKSLKNIYGPRAADRLNDIVNVIPFPGDTKSWRG